MGVTYGEYKQKIVEGSGRVSSDFSERHNRIINCEYALLGVRIPQIKKLAKIVPNDDRENVLDGFYKDGERLFETTLFVACVAAKKGDYVFTREHLKKIIPLFGSWAHTDTVAPLLRWTSPEEFLRDFEYLTGGGEYQKRMYIVYMMCCCLDERHIDFVLDRTVNYIYGEYYVDMAAAWLIAEALVKFYDKAIKVIEQNRLPDFVHNMAIKKARESFRITAEQKVYLASLKKV